jgi:hypothetical protein
VNRMANMVAHTLAKLAINTFIDRTWMSESPSCICDIIEREL